MCVQHRYAPMLLLIVMSVSIGAIGQSSPQSDPQALTLAAESIAALLGNTKISDITLTGNVTWIAGSDVEAGTGTLIALGISESRMDLVLNRGTRSEIRDASGGTAQGKWINPDGSSGMFAAQNCWTDAVWFFPALGSLTARSSVVLKYIGQELANGKAVQHLRSYVFPTYHTLVGISISQQLSSTDFYLDATTLLPITITFNQYPDNDSNAAMRVKIVFSGYQPFNGVQVPTHIMRYVQNTLTTDFTVTAASLNTGVPLSEFSVN